jgi:hypothetical protein
MQNRPPPQTIRHPHPPPLLVLVLLGASIPFSMRLSDDEEEAEEAEEDQLLGPKDVGEEETNL